MSTSESFNRLKACRHGQMLYNINDIYIGRSLDVYGEYSEGEIELFRQIVQPGHVVVEVGANIGSHTVFLAKQAGPRGLVMAFEPQRIVFQTLCANVALNSLANVHCIQNAVGAAPGMIKIPLLDYAQPNNFGGLALGSWDVGEQVVVVTIDSFNLQRCHFIKMDVEGMEEQALRGAVQTIERHKPILYVENDKADKSAALIRYIDSLGYNMYWHTPGYFNPNNFFNHQTDVFNNIISLNMLCIHKSIPQNLKDFNQVEVPAAE